MSRWKAAGVHLGISLIIAALVGSLIYFVWYPPPFFSVAGGSELMVLIMSVDVVLGPCLTLAVFRAGKKGMKFDLIVIALLQLTAFCYGASIIAAARPVFVVAEVDRFTVVASNELDDGDLSQGSEAQFASRSWTGPRLVAARIPTDSKEASALASAAFAGKDMDKFPKYYVPYLQAADDLLKRARPLATLISNHPEQSDQVERFVSASGQNQTELVYVPLRGHVASYAMVLSSRTKQPIGALAIDPW